MATAMWSPSLVCLYCLSATLWKKYGRIFGKFTGYVVHYTRSNHEQFGDVPGHHLDVVPVGDITEKWTFQNLKDMMQVTNGRIRVCSASPSETNYFRMFVCCLIWGGGGGGFGFLSAFSRPSLDTNILLPHVISITFSLLNLFCPFNGWPQDELQSGSRLGEFHYNKFFIDV